MERKKRTTKKKVMVEAKEFTAEEISGLLSLSKRTSIVVKKMFGDNKHTKESWVKLLQLNRVI